MLKRNFLIALAYAGLNRTQWARLHNVRLDVLSNVLHGYAVSKPVTTLVEAFISEQFPNLRKELNKVA
jgi:hypothetical protein